MKCRKSGKVRHATRNHAMILKKKLNNAGLMAYYCSRCKGWHLDNDRRDWNFQLRIDQLLSR